MAGSNAYVAGFKCPDDNITFGASLAAAPTGVAEDNDTFVVTSTGDATGTPTEVYKFDKDTGAWISIDLDTDISAVNAALAGTNLTVAVTEDGVTLTSTADLSSLLDDTDVSGTRILAGPTSTASAPTIQFGVTEDGVEVLSNEWPIPPVCPDEMTRAALLALRNAGNLSIGCHYVITDPGANGTLQLQKVLMHAVDANTLSGCYLKTAHDNTAWNGSYDIDTNLVDQVFDHLYDNEVKGNESVTTFPFGVAAVTDNRVDHGRLNYTAGTVTGVTIGKASTLNMIAGSLSQTSIDGDSDVTISSGTNYNNTIGGSSNLNQVGTGYIRQSSVINESTVTVGGVNILDTVFRRASVNTTGAAGYIYYSDIQRSFITAVDTALLQLSNLSMASNSQVLVSGAARCVIANTDMSSFGRVLVSAGALFDSNYTGLRDYSYIQVLQGRLTVNYSSLANVGYIQNNTPGTNIVDRANVTTNARIRFLGTSTACRVYYTNVSSGSIVEHRGTSTGCYFYYCDVTSSSTMYTNNSVNLRGYYNAVSGNSEYYSQNVTGTHYAYYNVLTGHGYLRHLDAAGGRFYAIHCSAQGLLQMTGVNANCYYSSFTAYYYLYLTAANISGTRTALHGYGRRSYTPTAVIPNGSYTQNF